MTDVAKIDRDDDDAVAEIMRLRAEIEVLRQRAEAAEALADYDVLTPVFNRRGFITAMRRIMAYSIRHEVPAVLLYLDLDGFKTINDTMGHAAGDAALVRVAQMLQDNVRATDAVGRLGGDEFAVVLLKAGLKEGKDKAAVLKQSLDAAPFEWEGASAPLGASFGVRALADHSDPEVWLAEADAAMWVRKRSR